MDVSLDFLFLFPCVFAACASPYVQGIHKQAWNTILAPGRVAKTAYFGHAYVGRYRMIVTNLLVSVAHHVPLAGHVSTTIGHL